MRRLFEEMALSREDTIFVSDLDGTLLQPDAQLSDETVRLLNGSIAEGKLFSVATARTPATVAPILSRLEMQMPVVVMTGAAIWDPRTQQYLETRFMSERTARELVEVYRRTQCNIFLYTIEAGVIEIYHIGGPMTDIERRFVEERAHTPFKHFHLSEDGSDTLPPRFDNVILFYGMQPAAVSRHAYEESLKVAGCRPQYYFDIYGETIGIVEAFADTATKANGIKRLEEISGATKSVVFGDNVNDMPMMETATLAVAVENALPEVKEMADVVIGPNTENSVAKFIDSF